MCCWTWRPRFMATNPDTWMKPGYTRRVAPPYRSGTVAITFCSNQLNGLEWANSFTLVGLTRVSAGPAMSTRLLGWARLSAAAISDAALSAAGHGWHTAIRWVPGPM